MKILPRYPVYIPSKGRANFCFTAKFFIEDGIDFKIVVEPAEYDNYKKVFGSDILLLLPENNLKLLGSRLWIREHSIKNGFDRHWQFDDNIRWIYRRYQTKRIRCNAGIAIRACEDFTDRYTNIGISGMNYEMFAPDTGKMPPYQLNCHVYSASLISNRMPYKWRLYYNDDTDICLQVVTNNMCTVLFNAFLIKKMRTMTLKGGNTDDLYKADGRLKMARSLEAMWPEYVTTRYRYGRPQHVIKDSWRCFKTPLIRRPDLDWDNLPAVNNYGMTLKKMKEIKSVELQQLYKEIHNE
jgi:hypothetical protein